MSLRSFLEQMDRTSKVLHVNDKLSTRFEIPFIMRNFDRGPVLLFGEPRGYSASIVANVCGSRTRISEALGIRKNDIYSKLIEAWRSPRRPSIAEDGPVKEVTESPDLSKIPILTHFEKDAGPYVTSAVVHAKSHDGRIENVSVHRFQVLDKTRLVIRMVPRHLFKLWQMARNANQDLELSISIGVHPAVILAASSPVPFGVSEFDVANTLMGNSLRLVKCEHVDACAPADSELVLEGKILPKEDAAEGPFVDITGTYDSVRRQPVVEVIGFTHRHNYLYQAILPSGFEHRLLMGIPREALIWESVSKVVPTVHTVNLSSGGSGWLHALMSIEKQVEGDGKNALLAAFAAHPSLKHAVVVDADINIHNTSDVEWAIATRFQASDDLIIIKNSRGSTLDSSADQETGLTTKVGIDATRPLTKPREKFERAIIPANKKVEEIIRRLDM
ncbi:UbiD family decarboxylase [Candidatus Bathyarchaeota archaeon]|nr:UbiD family decarboxylase [Candidatus Bathyarchaeota archaeon]